MNDVCVAVEIETFQMHKHHFIVFAHNYTKYDV